MFQYTYYGYCCCINVWFIRLSDTYVGLIFVSNLLLTENSFKK